MSGRDSPRGRETAAARSNERDTWFGYGRRARVEKSGIRLFLNDASRLATEVFVFALPVFLVLLVWPMDGTYDPWSTGIVMWVTATAVGTAIRIGWIHPPATDSKGWVTLGFPQVVLRAIYFTPTMALAVFGGAYLQVAVGAPWGMVWAAVVAAAAMALFPRLGEEVGKRWR